MLNTSSVKDRLFMAYWSSRWEINHNREKLQMWIVWHLPRWLIYWAFIRLAAHATTGRWGDTEPGKLDVMTAMKRWDVDR